MKPLRVLAALAFATLALSAHAVGRLADIAVFDRSLGAELPVYWHDGRAYVVGRPGAEYQVVVRNRAGEDLLAVVSVDGVNVLSGETASARQGGYVLSPWESLGIQGWRKSLAQTAAFYFTSLGDSYAARTDRPGNVGVIGAALFQRKEVPATPFAQRAAPEAQSSAKGAGAADHFTPRSEASAAPQESRARMQPSAPIGTGHGRREESYARYVEFRRRTAEPVETIAIYYDSYRNLVARGILRANVAPREPDPFPGGFVKDPT
jgi:hypothetical protein